MPIHDHISQFAGLPVADWSEGGDIEPRSALRLAVEYDDAEGTMAKLLESAVAHPKARQLRALVIGAWNSDSSMDSGNIVRFLSDNAARLPALGPRRIRNERPEVAEPGAERHLAQRHGDVADQRLRGLPPHEVTQS